MISRTFTFVFVCAIALHMAFALSESDFPEEDRVVLRPHELLFDATDIHERNARAFKDLAGVSFGTSYMFGSVSSCTAANISPVMSADGRTIVSRKLACVTSTGASPNTNTNSLDGLGPLPTATNLPTVRSDTTAPGTTSSTVVYQWRDNSLQEGWDTAYLPNSKTFAFSFAISNDAEWIAQAISDTPASSVRNVDVEVYKRYRARQDNLWYRVHKVSLTNVNQADEAMSLSLSADGLYLSIVYLDGGSTKTPQISVYKRNADFTYSSLTVSSLPTINVNFISHAMTPDAKHIVVPLTTLNTFAYYTRSDVDAFTFSQVLVPFPGGSLTGSPTFQLVDMAATGERIFIQATYSATPVVLTLTRARFNDDQSWVIENVFSSRKLAAARASTYYGREVLLVDSSNQISYAALNPTTRVWTATDVLTLKGQAATIASGGSYFFLMGISSEGVQLGIIEPARPRITSPVATTRWRVDTRVTVRWTPFVNYDTTPSTATVYLVDAETNAVLIQQVCINGREGAVTLNLLGLAPARTVFVAIVPAARGMSGMSMSMSMTMSSKRSVSGSGYISDRWDDIHTYYCQITYVSKSENRDNLVKPVQFYGTPSMDSRDIPETLQTFAPTGNWLQSENFHLTQ